MGTITYIYPDSRYWKVYESFVGCLRDATKKDGCGENVLRVQVGECDFDYDGLSGIIVYFRESVYKKIISRDYTFKRSHDPNQTIEVCDRHTGDIIKPYSDFVI
jgi:hypothetical protein